MLYNPYIALSFSAWFLVTEMQQLFSQLWNQWLLGSECKGLPHSLLQAEKHRSNLMGHPLTRLHETCLPWATFSTNCFSTKRCHGILMATDGHSFCFMSYLSAPPPPQSTTTAAPCSSWDRLGREWTQVGESCQFNTSAACGSAWIFLS